MQAHTLDAIQVIADPSRRHMLLMPSIDSMAINALAENFIMSRPAVLVSCKSSSTTLTNSGQTSSKNWKFF